MFSLSLETYKNFNNWSKNNEFKLDKLQYHYTWADMFNRLSKNKDIIKLIEDNINKELKKIDNPEKIYPKQELILRAFILTPMRRTKVVILGQDPYFNAIIHNNKRICQATGLSFSIPKGFTSIYPSSLNNIYNNLLKFKHIKTKPKHGSLDYWALQGCLMLNTSLTVIDNKRNCHSKIWQDYTNFIIKYINDNINFVVFVLWGREALKKLNIIDIKKHKVVISSHPSGLSYNSKMCQYPSFSELDHFGLINKFLLENGIIPIDWIL